MWEDILRQIAASPDIAASVNPPADEAHIAALQARLGAPLPEAFKAYLAAMDGQNDSGALNWIVDDARLLPVAEMVQQMDTMDMLFGDEEPIGHIAENRIQPRLWDPLWLPFAEFEGAPRLILDLHPGKNGVAGQVFVSYPGVDLEDDATVIAESFEAFSADLLQRLQNPA